MATRMTNDPNLRNDTTYTRPVVWPWVVLAVVIVLALWWAAANNANHNMTSNGPGVTNTAPGVTPGIGGGTAPGGTVAPGNGTTTTTPPTGTNP